MIIYNTIEYIDTVDGFNAAIKHLLSADSVAFDLEFDSSRYSYGFTLCLVQICTKERCFVIDPFKIKDLKPLFAILENPSILKIAHSGDQDLRLLHSLKCYPQEVADTETIARLLNYEFCGLAHLLQEKFDLEIDKKLQASNWTLRPLSQAQIHYAANDVTYLFDLYNLLMQEAKEKNILEWVKDETSAHNNIRFDKEEEQTDFLSKSDRKECTEFQQYVLNELLKYRETFAKRYNKPPYQVIDNQWLRDLVKGDKDFSLWMEAKAIFKSLRTIEIKNAFEAIYNRATKEATDLDLNYYGRRRLTNEERMLSAKLMAEREENKLIYFKPIQSKIIELYGLHTSRYLLSEGFINNVLREHIKLGNLPTPYRRNMILNIAKELDINLSAYW